MDKAFAKIKKAWEDQPLHVIAVASLAATAVSKLLKATTEAQNAQTWKKEVERRRMSTMRR